MVQKHADFPILQRVLEIASPVIANAKATYKEQLKKKLKKVTTFTTGKKVEKHVPLTEREIEWHLEEFDRAANWDLIKVATKYLLKTDTFISCVIKFNLGGTIMELTLSRDGNRRYFMNTQIIYAGGYNIQRLHLRYLVNSDLPKQENKALISRMSKMQKLEVELKNLREQQTTFEDTIVDLKNTHPGELYKKDFKHYSETFADLAIRYQAEKIQMLERRLVSVLKSQQNIVDKIESMK